MSRKAAFYRELRRLRAGLVRYVEEMLDDAEAGVLLDQVDEPFTVLVAARCSAGGVSVVERIAVPGVRVIEEPELLDEIQVAVVQRIGLGVVPDRRWDWQEIGPARMIE